MKIQYKHNICLYKLGYMLSILPNKQLQTETRREESAQRHVESASYGALTCCEVTNKCVCAFAHV